MIVKKLGLRPYEEVWQSMQAFTAARDELTEDELWVVEHPPVFTQGQAGKAEHLLMPGDIPVVQSDRGGQVTYHGPGQLVIYVLVDLKRAGLGVRDLVTAIEQSVIGYLAAMGVTAVARPEAPGVYVQKSDGSAGAKIASLGLRVKRWRSYHGLSLNVDMDLSPFACINPCGLVGQEVTQLVDEVAPSRTRQATIDQAAHGLLLKLDQALFAA